MKMRVDVKPNSKEQSIEEKDDGLLVRVKSPPVGNKANTELVKLLKKHFKGKKVKIKTGFKSNKKIIEVII